MLVPSTKNQVRGRNGRGSPSQSLKRSLGMLDLGGCDELASKWRNPKFDINVTPAIDPKQGEIGPE